MQFITFDWFSYTIQIKGRSLRLPDLPLNTLHNSEQMEYNQRIWDSALMSLPHLCIFNRVGLHCGICHTPTKDLFRHLGVEEMVGW